MNVQEGAHDSRFQFIIYKDYHNYVLSYISCVLQSQFNTLHKPLKYHCREMADEFECKECISKLALVHSWCSICYYELGQLYLLNIYVIH